ncbi:hypothetical protein AAC387_Pa05g0290 [Persea americana]
MDPPTRSSKVTQGSSSAPTQLPPLKSNLKKTTTLEPQEKNGKRKVSWPDAHGKDLAHVQEFQSSALEDGEIEGVRNSCVCVIQ